MALPSRSDLETQIANIQTLITAQITAMTSGAADVSYTLPTGVSVNRQGYLKYLMEVQQMAINNLKNFYPTMVVSRGR